MGQRGDLRCREQPVIQPHILQQHAIRAGALPPLAQLKGRVAGYRILQCIKFYLFPFGIAVEIDGDATGFSRPVVGHEDMLPFFALERLFCDDLDGIIVPLADDVGHHLPILQKQIPAPEAVAFVHARKESSVRGLLRNFHPCAEGEGLVPLESIIPRKLHGRSGRDAVALLIYRAVFRTNPGRRGGFLLPSGC